MNFLNLIGLILWANAQDIQAFTEAQVRTMRRMVIMAILVPIGLMVLAIRAGVMGDIEFAHTAAGIAGIMSALLLVLTMVRASIIATILVLATQGGKQLFNKLPALDQTTTEKFMRWIWGICAWLMLTAVACQIIPFWHDIRATVISATCLLAGVGIMAAGWYKAVLIRHLAVFSLITTASISILWLMVPRFVSGVVDVSSSIAAGVVEMGSSEAAKVAAWSDKRLKANGINLTAGKQLSQIDQARLQKFKQRQVDINADAMSKGCDVFCNPGQQDEYNELQSKIELLEAGELLSSKLAIPPPPPAPPAPPAPAPQTPQQDPEAVRLLKALYPETSK